MEFLRTSGSHIVTEAGTLVTLRGMGLGGWLTMENWITGFPAYEQAFRRVVKDVLGRDLADFFFERFLHHYFQDADAAYISSLGFNVVRLPVGYRHFEDDLHPFTLKEEGFQRLDWAIETLAAHGIYTIIDLHALPGCQNMGWHADNPTHVNLLWEHPHFQDRVVHLWRVLARRYRSNPAVAAYNPMNEPVCEDGEAVARLSLRLLEAIRTEDPDHIVVLDGNRYGTDFTDFREPLSNVIYSPHYYVQAGFVPNARYPGWVPNPYARPEILRPGPGRPPVHTPDADYVDRELIEDQLMRKTKFMRERDTPLLIGEFNVVFTGDPELDAMRAQLLEDQVALHEKLGASWIFWGFKDIGLVGPLTVDPDSPWLRRIASVVRRKARFGTDEWGRDHAAIQHVISPLKALFESEFPDYEPYPWGAGFMIERLALQMLLGEALLPEFGECFRGMTETEIDDMMQSFRFERCHERVAVADIMRHVTGGVPV